MSRGGSPHSPRAPRPAPPVEEIMHLRAGCSKCMVTPAAGGSKFRKCSRCLVASYCSPECQRADWPTHKLDCTALSKLHDAQDEIKAAEKASGRPKDAKGVWQWYQTIPHLTEAVALLAGARGLPSTSTYTLSRVCSTIRMMRPSLTSRSVCR